MKRYGWMVLPLLTGSVYAQSQVLVVDATAGPFFDIQSAVVAASDGDNILVRGGANYSSVEINGKGLSIFGETGTAPQVQGRLLVENLSAAQQVTIRGIDFTVNVADTNLLQSNEGSVWLEDCDLVDTYLVPVLGFGGPHHGLTIDDCDEVVLTRCLMQGGELGDGGGSLGASGLSTSLSTVAIQSCVLRGDDKLLRGAAGGSGALISSSQIFTSDSVYTGGTGGSGNVFHIPPGTVCGDGGPGGDGIFIEGASSIVNWFDCTFVGGAGGIIFGQCAGQATPGPDGLDVNLVDGAINEWTCDTRSFEVSATSACGGSVTLTYTGQPNEVVWLYFSPQQDYVLSQPACGVSQLGAPISLGFQGVIPASGTLTQTINLGGCGQDFTIHLQAQFIDVAAAQVFLPGASSLMFYP